VSAPIVYSAAPICTSIFRPMSSAKRNVITDEVMAPIKLRELKRPVWRSLSFQHWLYPTEVQSPTSPVQPVGQITCPVVTMLLLMPMM
jgi:hypothetical protein